MKKDQRFQRWIQKLDIPGLIGCAILIVTTYAIFWYYSETIKGTFGTPMNDTDITRSLNGEGLQ